MKSAYELAMERLEKESPTHKLTAKQKTAIADLDAQLKAKIAEREMFLREQINKAIFEGKDEEVEQLEKQLAVEIRRLNEDAEAKKKKVREGR